MNKPVSLGGIAPAADRERADREQIGRSLATFSAPDRPDITEVAGGSATTRLLEFAAGLYAVTVAPTAALGRYLAGMATPATQIGVGLAGGVDVFPVTDAPAGWVGPDGGAVVLRVTAPYAVVTVTTYRDVSEPATPIAIQIARLDRFDLTIAGAAEARGLPLEVIASISSVGETRAGGGDWVGERGGLAIEAFGVRVLSDVAESDLECRALGPNGKQTSWAAGGRLCGSKGRGIPLVGFAVRLAPRAAERFSVEYEGIFVSGAGPVAAQDGAPCVSPHSNDPLQALLVKVKEREPG